MSGYNFTEHVRKALVMAREEAARLHHEYVGTEHIVLGLVREREGVAAAVLQNLAIDTDQIRNKIEETIKKGVPKGATDLPYTSRAKKVLELAMAEARELSHSYVGTEHLLLGLLREERGIGAQVLNYCGLKLDAARAEVLRVLGTAGEAAEHEARARGGGIDYVIRGISSVRTERDPLRFGHARPERVSSADEPAVSLPKREAELRYLENEIFWSQVRNALDVCQRLGVAPRITLKSDGKLLVAIGERLLLAV